MLKDVRLEGKATCSQRKEHNVPGQFVCDQCGSRFYEKGHLKSHMSVHVEEKRFTCGTCGNSYKSSNQLGFHRKNVHDASHVPCELCGASVKNIGVHKRMVHGGEAVRKHECPYCNKRFKLKGEINIHIRIRMNN
jgi:KRAB domain-containing zinc finger protein